MNSEESTLEHIKQDFAPLASFELNFDFTFGTDFGNFEHLWQINWVLSEQYENILQQSANDLDPSVIATYLFQLAQSFNSFYANHSIGNAESEGKKQLRLRIASLTSTIIASGMQMLGIKVPEKM